MRRRSSDGQLVQTTLLTCDQSPLYHSGMTGMSVSEIFWSLEVIAFIAATSSTGVLSSCWTRAQASAFS